MLDCFKSERIITWLKILMVLVHASQDFMIIMWTKSVSHVVIKLQTVYNVTWQIQIHQAYRAQNVLQEIMFHQVINVLHALQYLLDVSNANKTEANAPNAMTTKISKKAKHSANVKVHIISIRRNKSAFRVATSALIVSSAKAIPFRWVWEAAPSNAHSAPTVTSQKGPFAKSAVSFRWAALSANRTAVLVSHATTVCTSKEMGISANAKRVSFSTVRRINVHSAQLWIQNVRNVHKLKLTVFWSTHVRSVLMETMQMVPIVSNVLTLFLAALPVLKMGVNVPFAMTQRISFWTETFANVKKGSISTVPRNCVNNVTL